jgi:hypothetical protein
MWQFSRREILVMLAAAAASTWVAMVVVVLMRQPILGGDFMEFYTLGHLARDGQWALQYDWPALHRLQVALVPQSDAYPYGPSYPPLVPALYVPLAWFSFEQAFVIWFVASGAIYAAMMVVAARACPQWPTVLVVLGALIFPPFIAHQIIGQSTIWPLVGFVGGAWALARGRPFLAGTVLSLVAIKPHLGMALAVVLLASAQWRAVAGIVCGGSLQAALTLLICGTGAIAAYLQTTLTVLRNPAIIEPIDTRHTHAFRMALEQMLPAGAATVAWLAEAPLVSWMAVSVWRRTDNMALRMSALLLATLLVSPHVLTYDAILLAPAALWLSAAAAPSHRASAVAGLGILSVAFLVPWARIGGLPITIPLMLWLLFKCRSEAGRDFQPHAQRA